jgi:hypothetical protein
MATRVRTPITAEPETPTPAWPSFFGGLFARCDGLIELRALPSASRVFCPPTDHDEIAKFLTTYDHENLYMGVATRRDSSNGKLENCLHVGALFTDIDFKSTPEPDARERLARLVCAPSAVVHSGGGLHAYWWLREPLTLPDDAARAKSLLRRLAVAVGGDLAAAEPARVLRVPGTWNRKPEYGEPRAVRIEEAANASTL